MLFCNNLSYSMTCFYMIIFTLCEWIKFWGDDFLQITYHIKRDQPKKRK